MTDAPPSPKRRRILSSMNTDGYVDERRSASPNAAASMFTSQPPFSTPPLADNVNGDQAAKPDPSEAAPKPSRFRFKSKHSSRHHHRSSRHRQDDRDSRRDDHESSSSRRHRHHRHKRRHRTPPLAEPEETPDPAASGRLSPNAAFRESLFDAMADDEGAAYWEGVYGQPIHVYSRDKPSDSTDPERGELERMTDDEYATFVRRKMWEKTHAGLLEERARREEEKKRKEREREENRRITEEMERSLRRGEERRRRKVWKQGWERYSDAWAGWDGAVDALPWPTRSGTRERVGAEGEVREFFEKGLDREELGEKEFSARLKEERVRWHPDKVQQKLGGTVEGDVMKDVTAIFQIIDRLWNDTRSKA